MKKTIVVTGAAGFIGYHLAAHLVKRGDAVLGYDNFNDYYPVSLKRERVKQLNTMGVEVIEGDICDFAKLSRCIEKFNPTHIAHLAAQAGVRYSIVNPQAFIKSNLDGFLNILEICRKWPIKLIYASSSSVYGLNTKVPFCEDDPCDRQANLYGTTKKSNELMAFSYHHLFGIHATGLRFFTVYGPWGRPDMACYKFAQAILDGKPIEIYNYGNMERDFTYIDDIIEGTTAAIDLGAPYEIFNLGNHKPEKLMTLVELLEKYTGKKAQLKQLPMQAGDVLSTYADISRSNAKLNFHPRTSLDEGVKKFVSWLDHYKGVLQCI